jgi:hypothetical protein
VKHVDHAGQVSLHVQQCVDDLHKILEDGTDLLQDAYAMNGFTFSKATCNGKYREIPTHVMFLGQLHGFVYGEHSSVRDAPSWHVDDSLERQPVLWIVHKSQVRQQVFDLGAMFELLAPDHFIGDLLRKEFLFQETSLVLSAIQNGYFSSGVTGLLNQPGKFGVHRFEFMDGHSFPFLIFTPLRLPRRVVLIGGGGGGVKKVRLLGLETG